MPFAWLWKDALSSNYACCYNKKLNKDRLQKPDGISFHIVIVLICEVHLLPFFFLTWNQGLSQLLDGLYYKLLDSFSYLFLLSPGIFSNHVWHYVSSAFSQFMFSILINCFLCFPIYRHLTLLTQPLFLLYIMSCLHHWPSWQV